jgi:hypothetical protein
MAIQQSTDWEGNTYYWDDSSGERVAAPDAPVQSDYGYTTPAPENQPAPSIQSDQGWTTPAAPAPEVTITPENVAQAYQDVTGSPPPPQWVEQTVAAYSGDPSATVANVIRDTTTAASASGTPFANVAGDQGTFTTGADYYQKQGYIPGGTTLEGVPTSFIDPSTGQVVAQYGVPTTDQNTTSHASNLFQWNPTSSLPKNTSVALAVPQTDYNTGLLDAAKGITSVAAALFAPEIIGALTPAAVAPEAIAGGDALASLAPTTGAGATGVNLGSALESAATNAALKGGLAALTGQCITKAAISGGITGGLNPVLSCFLGGCTFANIAARAGTGALANGVTGGNPVTGAIAGGSSAALSALVPKLTQGMTGCLCCTTKNAINKAISSGISSGISGGNPLLGAILGAAGSGIKSGLSSLKDCGGGGGDSGGDSGNSGTFTVLPDGTVTGSQVIIYGDGGLGDETDSNETGLPTGCVPSCCIPFGCGTPESNISSVESGNGTSPTGVINGSVNGSEFNVCNGSMPDITVSGCAPCDTPLNICIAGVCNTDCNPLNICIAGVCGIDGCTDCTTCCTDCTNCCTDCTTCCDYICCTDCTTCCTDCTCCTCCTDCCGGGLSIPFGKKPSTKKKSQKIPQTNICNPCLDKRAYLLSVGKKNIADLAKIVTGCIGDTFMGSGSGGTTLGCGTILHASGGLVNHYACGGCICSCASLLNDKKISTINTALTPLITKPIGDPVGLAHICNNIGCVLPVCKGLGYACLASGGNVHQYASGGKSDYFCINQYEPKFECQRAEMLTRSGSGMKIEPTALHQIKCGIAGHAKGGLPHKYNEAAPAGHNPEFITGLTGYYACGGGTGQSDDIPAMLHDGDYVMDAETVSALGDGSSKAGMHVLEGFRSQIPHKDGASGNPVPAKIADGEYVFPAAFVTALGHGDNKRGSEILDGLREKLRAHKRGAPLDKIPPKAKSPLDYIKKGTK